MKKSTGSMSVGTTFCVLAWNGRTSTAGSRAATCGARLGDRVERRRQAGGACRHVVAAGGDGIGVGRRLLEAVEHGAQLRGRRLRRARASTLSVDASRSRASLAACDTWRAASAAPASSPAATASATWAPVDATLAMQLVERTQRRLAPADHRGHDAGVDLLHGEA